MHYTTATMSERELRYNGNLTAESETFLLFQRVSFYRGCTVAVPNLGSMDPLVVHGRL